MKSSIFWDITPCSPLKAIWLFRGIHHLHFQCRRVNQIWNPHETGSKLCFDPEYGGDIFPPKRQLTFEGLHGVVSQKIEFFIRHSVSSVMSHSCQSLYLIVTKSCSLQSAVFTVGSYLQLWGLVVDISRRKFFPHLRTSVFTDSS
jgi:hypothetical protein